MKVRVAIYALLIGTFALASAIYGHVTQGEAITVQGLIAAAVFVPVAAFMIWLRWDWAVPLGRKRRAERKALKQRNDAP